MNNEPTCKLISVKDLAALANLTVQRIYQLINDGVLPSLNDGALPHDESIFALFKWYQRDSEQLKHERLLYAKASRELREQELLISKGKYILLDVARATGISFARGFKNIVRQQVELFSPNARREKLIELGVPEHIVQQFHNFDLQKSIAVITAIENEARKAAEA